MARQGGILFPAGIYGIASAVPQSVRNDNQLVIYLYPKRTVRFRAIGCSVLIKKAPMRDGDCPVLTEDGGSPGDMAI